MADNVRNIVTCFLIYVDWKPVTILMDKKKSQQLVSMAKDKGKEAFSKEMTIPETRMKEIGKNIFTYLKDMDEKTVANIINVRNSMIRESFEIADTKKVDVETAWESLSKKKGDPFDQMTYQEFNQWTLDVSQFVLIKR